MLLAQCQMKGIRKIQPFFMPIDCVCKQGWVDNMNIGQTKQLAQESAYLIRRIVIRKA